MSVHFIVALPRTQRGNDAIMVAVDRFSKIALFVHYYKIDDISCNAKIYFKNIIRLHSVPQTFIYDHNSKFLSYF